MGSAGSPSRNFLAPSQRKKIFSAMSSMRALAAERPSFFRRASQSVRWSVVTAAGSVRSRSLVHHAAKDSSDRRTPVW